MIVIMGLIYQTEFIPKKNSYARNVVITRILFILNKIIIIIRHVKRSHQTIFISPHLIHTEFTFSVICVQISAFLGCYAAK